MIQVLCPYLIRSCLMLFKFLYMYMYVPTPCELNCSKSNYSMGHFSLVSGSGLCSICVSTEFTYKDMTHLRERGLITFVRHGNGWIIMVASLWMPLFATNCVVSFMNNSWAVATDQLAFPCTSCMFSLSAWMRMNFDITFCLFHIHHILVSVL